MGELDDAGAIDTSTAVRWLDAREETAWRSFLAMHLRLLRLLGQQLQDATGLSEADYVVLVNLSETAGGRLRPFELGAAAGWEKSRLSHHLTRMERRGLVERQNCPSDNRGAFVTLTDAGLSAIRAAAPLHVEQVRRWFFAALTSDQVDGITAISDAVLAGLDAVDAACGSEDPECVSEEVGGGAEEVECGSAADSEWAEDRPQ